MREAVELLAKEWPEEYPAGAAEWLIADELQHVEQAPAAAISAVMTGGVP
jgi:hypothetical protein